MDLNMGSQALEKYQRCRVFLVHADYESDEEVQGSQVGVVLYIARRGQTME